MRLPQFNGGRDFLVAEMKGALVALAESSLREQPQRFVRYVKTYRSSGTPSARNCHKTSCDMCSLKGPTDSDTELQSTIRLDWAAGVGFLTRFGFKEIEREIFMHSSAIAR